VRYLLLIRRSSDPAPFSQRFRGSCTRLKSNSPGFLLTELLAVLKREKMIRPGYHTLQAIISRALTAERRRLGDLVDRALDENAQAIVEQLLNLQGQLSEVSISDLTTVQQDAKSFRYGSMDMERKKRILLGPLYRAAKDLLPRLDISQRNIEYYASLATFYTIWDLNRIKADQTRLYLLSYAWQRYRIPTPSTTI
jgi:hypothetical protein